MKLSHLREANSFTKNVHIESLPPTFSFQAFVHPQHLGSRIPINESTPFTVSFIRKCWEGRSLCCKEKGSFDSSDLYRIYRERILLPQLQVQKNANLDSKHRPYPHMARSFWWQITLTCWEEISAESIFLLKLKVIINPKYNWKFGQVDQQLIRLIFKKHAAWQKLIIAHAEFGGDECGSC